MLSTDPKKGAECHRVKDHCSLQLQISLLLAIRFQQEPAYIKPNPSRPRVSELRNHSATAVGPAGLPRDPPGATPPRDPPGATPPARPPRATPPARPPRRGPREPGGSTKPRGLRPHTGQHGKTRPLPLDRTQIRAATRTAEPQDRRREGTAEETPAARAASAAPTFAAPTRPATVRLAVLLPSDDRRRPSARGGLRQAQAATGDHPGGGPVPAPRRRPALRHREPSRPAPLRTRTGPHKVKPSGPGAAPPGARGCAGA
ncbi:nascent polypeptide-associated complex subunit alpha, muscle-specific form-like [Mustela putorius furo]|uniref:Nascent polypeptide-associated complex subunit alpha, muscle-specific form-like n=1 Tax=Mustela putorius furo TaxID=9669 RepID=A0A8U0V1G4_MUSPF|nr:nascent polypeptide-associated complex subunit alpha, muscle-specific form-like [Mustela putorius furo]